MVSAANTGLAIAIGRYGMVPAMRMTVAAGTLFFHVSHFSRTANVTIAADDTAAWQGSEAEEPDYAHEPLPPP